MTLSAEAAYKRYFQDPKWPNDKSVYRQTFTNPVAASASYIIGLTNGNTTSSAATLSTFNNQPDVPRNLVIDPNESTAGCAVTVTGTDARDQALVEQFSWATNVSAAVTGSKAFKTVSSIAFPASCELNAYTVKWDVGVGEKLGLDRCLTNAGDIFFSQIDGAKEGTAPTIAANSSQVGYNTADFNGTMDGSSDFNLLYFHNYATTCLP